MLVLTGATGKITAVTVWEENIVTKQQKKIKMHLFTGGWRGWGGGTDCAGIKGSAGARADMAESDG